jgi:nudix-type nucleoside diphosphatase (YffH/AdpP family)
MSLDDDTIRIGEVRVLAQSGFSVLRSTAIDYRRRDGTWQALHRETYDRGNGAAILLYDPGRDCVLLVRQFRYPVHANPLPGRTGGKRGELVEVPAGLLNDHQAAGRSVEEAIRAEAQEEAGVAVAAPRHILDAYTSPGSVTERIAFFVATYRPQDRTGAGGGLIEEGEDIAVLEPRLDEALAMVSRGEIADCKTIVLLFWAALNRGALSTPGQSVQMSG